MAPTQFRGRVRSPIRRSPEVEIALVERWTRTDDDDEWSVLDAAWLTGMSPGTITARIRSGALAVVREPQHGWRRIKKVDLRPLVDEGRRTFGPGRLSS